MVAYTFFLFALVVDRALALRDPLKYKKSINSMQTRLGLMLCWILALASSVPLMSKTIESWPFPSRFGCQVSQSSTPCATHLLLTFRSWTMN